MLKKKILVTDDEKAILMLFEKAFSRKGFEVRTASSAKEALALLENEEISVMFLDLNMPEMDGLELCRQIKKDRPMSIIFAITGYASMFELVKCRDVGFDDYFKKPVDLKKLINASNDAFEKLNRWKKS